MHLSIRKLIIVFSLVALVGICVFTILNPFHLDKPESGVSDQSISIDSAHPFRLHRGEMERNTSQRPSSSSKWFIDKMESLDDTVPIHELTRARKVLVWEARDKLRGFEWANFLEYLNRHHGYSLTTEAFGSVAGSNLMEGADSDRRAALEWALNLDDLHFRSQILGRLGEHIEEHELEYVLPQLGARPASELLRDYCRKLAQTDAEKAVETFIRLRPRGVDFGELRRVMSAMPPETDFAAVDAMLPNDRQGAANSTRSSLLRRWASVDPQAALDYVAANPERVAADQLNVVLASWAGIHPRRAEDWVQQQTDPGLRSQGAHAMSTILENQSPRRAWDWALEIQDHDLREARLTQIHEVWSRHNPQAADEALAALYE